MSANLWGIVCKDAEKKKRCCFDRLTDCFAGCGKYKDPASSKICQDDCRAKHKRCEEYVGASSTQSPTTTTPPTQERAPGGVKTAPTLKVNPNTQLEKR